MTFGRPPSIPNSYLQMELPLEIELEALDTSNIQSADLASDSGPSTVAVYTQSM
jgi:hypothetical protein